MTYRFSLLLLLFVNIMTAQSNLDWRTEAEVDKLFEDEPKNVLVLYSADWCAHCDRLKKFLNKNSKKLNKKWYLVYEDATDKEYPEIEIYPTIHIYEYNGSTIGIQGSIPHYKIETLLEL